MTIADLGGLSVGGAAPGAATAVVAGEAGINGALPDIQARLTALLAFSPAPINFAASIAIANSVIASINAAITAGIVPPDFSAQIAIATAQIATLTAAVAAVNAQLAILVALEAPLAVGGLHGYAFDGDASVAGAEIGGAITGDFAGHVNALVLVTSSPSTWTALGQILKVTP